MTLDLCSGVSIDLAFHKPINLFRNNTKIISLKGSLIYVILLFKEFPQFPSFFSDFRVFDNLISTNSSYYCPMFLSSSTGELPLE